MIAPGLLAPEHVELVNGLLMGHTEVAARCAVLDRVYVVHYELDCGPYGGPVDAALVLGPGAVRLELEHPAQRDVVVRSDWSRTLEATRLGRDAGSPTRAPVTVVADAAVLTTLRPVLAAVEAAAPVAVSLPGDR